MNYTVLLTDEFFNRDYTMNIFWKVYVTDISVYNRRPYSLPDGMFHFCSDEVHERINGFLLENDFRESNNPYAIYFGEYFNDEAPFQLIAPNFGVAFVFFEQIEILNKVEFFKLCLQFAYKALEAMEVFHLKKKGIVDDKWESEIKELIPKIEEKVKEVIEIYGDDPPASASL